MRRLCLAVLVTIALSGCDTGKLPSKAEVIAEFEKAHPNATVTDAVVGEGDFRHAYWTIRYTESGSREEKHAEWGVRSIDEGSWEVSIDDAEQSKREQGTGGDPYQRLCCVLAASFGS